MVESNLIQRIMQIGWVAFFSLLADSILQNFLLPKNSLGIKTTEE